MNSPPGDSSQIAWREAMGLKRYNYAALTNEIITPQKAVDYGLANEVVPADKIYDRARELAREICKRDRVVRGLTTQMLRTPWRKAIAEELRGGFATEMFSHSANHAEFQDLQEKNPWLDYRRELGLKDEHENYPNI